MKKFISVLALCFVSTVSAGEIAKWDEPLQEVYDASFFDDANEYVPVFWMSTKEKAKGRSYTCSVGEIIGDEFNRRYSVKLIKGMSFVLSAKLILKEKDETTTHGFALFIKNGKVLKIFLPEGYRESNGNWFGDVFAQWSVDRNNYLTIKSGVGEYGFVAVNTFTGDGFYYDSFLGIKDGDTPENPKLGIFDCVTEDKVLSVYKIIN